jgi:hypothetical protein
LPFNILDLYPISKIILFLGSGPYNDKGILDDDTVQFTSYHYYRYVQSSITLNATVAMAEKIKVIPVDISLDGSTVR